MMFFIFDDKRELASNIVKDQRYKITYQIYDVIKVNETERNDSSSCSSDEDSSSFESECADYRKFYRLEIDDLMLSIFLEVEERISPQPETYETE